MLSRSCSRADTPCKSVGDVSLGGLGGGVKGKLVLGGKAGGAS